LVRNTLIAIKLDDGFAQRRLAVEKIRQVC
jgi:hypothetical protein